MPLASPSSSSWYLPRFSAEEMEAALSNFQHGELKELNSSKLPLFDLPSGADNSAADGLGTDFYIEPSDSDA